MSADPAELYEGSANLFALYYEHHRGDLNEPSTAGVLSDLLERHGYHLSGDQIRQALRAMFAVTQENWLPEQDALPTLDALKRSGYRIGLISNASDDDNTQALIDKGGFRPYLEYIVSSASLGKRKPHPHIFRSALDYFGIPPQQVVMVGDDYGADVVGATDIGMHAILITRRAYEPMPVTAAVRADAVVSSLAEIPALLPAPA